MLDLLARAQMRYPERDGFKVTQTMIDDIKDALKTKPNPVRVATQFGVPTGLARFIQNELPSGTTSFTRHSEDGWGRKELRPYIVARKPAAAPSWDRNDEVAILKARAHYDEGVSELVQGRDGDFIILYSIPRRKKARRNYVYFSFEDDQ